MSNIIIALIYSVAIFLASKGMLIGTVAISMLAVMHLTAFVIIVVGVSLFAIYPDSFDVNKLKTYSVHPTHNIAVHGFLTVIACQFYTSGYELLTGMLCVSIASSLSFEVCRLIKMRSSTNEDS
jgi:hypothetical protein